MSDFHSFFFTLNCLAHSQLFSPYTFREYPYQGGVSLLPLCPKSVHTPGTNRASRSCWLLCQHQGQKNAKQEQRILSRRKWALSSGRPHLTFGTIIEYGNTIEKQNWSVSCCHGNDWPCISLGPTPPPHF